MADASYHRLSRQPASYIKMTFTLRLSLCNRFILRIVMKKFLLLASVAALLAPSSMPSVHAAAALTIPGAWEEPIEPFRIVGNIYYVGTRGLAAYLIADGKQAILLDGTLPQNATLIEESIGKLGFKLRDVKIMLATHAHLDHAGGLAKLKRDSGAIFYASAGDRPALESGRHDGETNYAQGVFPPVKVDRDLKDGQAVTLGDIRITATLTPGHTKGCTTWSMPVTENQRVLQVVFPCSLSGGGNILVANKAYPGIVDDYQKSFAKVDWMKADIVLTSHPEAADIIGRASRQQAGDDNAFVDPDLLQKIVAKSRADFKIELTKQQKKKRN
ncbi:MAG: subclass B3 metallo-beta-lactamase [Mesorhizobium sp.]